MQNLKSVLVNVQKDQFLALGMGEWVDQGKPWKTRWNCHTQPARTPLAYTYSGTGN